MRWSSDKEEIIINIKRFLDPFQFTDSDFADNFGQGGFAIVNFAGLWGLVPQSAQSSLYSSEQHRSIKLLFN